jgi:hypothetical protein
MTEVGTKDFSQLNWDVLITPGIPIATTDLPPGMKQVMFQAIASTLIYGKRDAVLVDAYMAVKQNVFLFLMLMLSLSANYIPLLLSVPHQEEVSPYLLSTSDNSSRTRILYT